MSVCSATNPIDPYPLFFYCCTLDADHAGDHVSDDSTGFIYVTWPTTDPRIAIASHALTTHATAKVRASWHPLGEHFTCKCGGSWSGAGAIRSGHVHTVVELLASLDAAMAVAS